MIKQELMNVTNNKRYRLGTFGRNDLQNLEHSRLFVSTVEVYDD